MSETENNNCFDKQTLEKFQVKNLKVVNNNCIVQIPTGYPVLNFIENFPLFKDISFSRSYTKRYINKNYITVKVVYKCLDLNFKYEFIYSFINFFVN